QVEHIPENPAVSGIFAAAAGDETRLRCCMALKRPTGREQYGIRPSPGTYRHCTRLPPPGSDERLLPNCSRRNVRPRLLSCSTWSKGLGSPIQASTGPE